MCGAASWHASLYIRKHKQPRDMMWYVTAVHDQRCMGMTWASAAVLPDSHPASSPQITHMFTNYLDSNASILKRIALSPPQIGWFRARIEILKCVMFLRRIFSLIHVNLLKLMFLSRCLISNFKLTVEIVV